MNWLLPASTEIQEMINWEDCLKNGWVVTAIDPQSVEALFYRHLSPPWDGDQARHVCESDDPHWQLSRGDAYSKRVQAEYHIGGRPTYYWLSIAKKFGRYYADKWSGGGHVKSDLLEKVTDMSDIFKFPYAMSDMSEKEIKDMFDELRADDAANGRDSYD